MPASAITIRPETPADRDAIRQVHISAFGQAEEADLVDALRDSDAYVPGLSLVAVAVGGHIVGHILFTRVSIEASSGAGHPALALAPPAGTPKYQRQGIGTALVREGLSACRRLGEATVVVLGHPDYFARFGFVPASQHGITSPFPAPDEAFMVLDLTPGALDDIYGLVRYPAPFDSV